MSEPRYTVTVSCDACGKEQTTPCTKEQVQYDERTPPPSWYAVGSIQNRFISPRYIYCSTQCRDDGRRRLIVDQQTQVEQRIGRMFETECEQYKGPPDRYKQAAEAINRELSHLQRINS